MAVHFTLYLEAQPAEELRRFMAAHACGPTKAVELLLRRVNRANASAADREIADAEPAWLVVA